MPHRRLYRRLKVIEERAITQDFRVVLGLRAWPIALMVSWFLQIVTAAAPPGVPAAGGIIDAACWSAIIASGAAVIHPARGLRWLHLFTAFAACLSRSFFQLFGFANSDIATQLLGASLWGGLALATLSIYLLTLPYVIDRESQRLGAM